MEKRPPIEEVELVDNGSYHVRKLIAEGGPTPLSRIRSYIQELQTARSEKTGRPLQAISIRTVCYEIRASVFFSLAEEIDMDSHLEFYLTRFFARITPKVENPVAKRKHLTLEEALMMCSVARRRYALPSIVAIISGARVGELAKIRRSDITFDNDMAFISIFGKRSRIREIYLPTALVMNVMAEFDSKEYLFEKEGGGQFTRQGLSDLIQGAAKHAGLRRGSPHDLKKVFANYLVDLLPAKKQAIMQYVGTTNTTVFDRHYDMHRLLPEDIRPICDLVMKVRAA